MQRRGVAARGAPHPGRCRATAGPVADVAEGGVGAANRESPRAAASPAARRRGVSAHLRRDQRPRASTHEIRPAIEVAAECRCTRRMLVLPDAVPNDYATAPTGSLGQIEIPGAGNKHGDVAVFMREQCRAVDDALGSYIANYDEQKAVLAAKINPRLDPAMGPKTAYAFRRCTTWPNGDRRAERSRDRILKQFFSRIDARTRPRLGSQVSSLPTGGIRDDRNSCPSTPDVIACRTRLADVDVGADRTRRSARPTTTSRAR